MRTYRIPWVLKKVGAMKGAAPKYTAEGDDGRPHDQHVHFLFEGDLIMVWDGPTPPKWANEADVVLIGEDVGCPACVAPPEGQ